MRFLNTLTTEIKNGRDIFSCDRDKIDIEEFIGKINKCIEKVENYSHKHESQTEKLAEKIGDTESEFNKNALTKMKKRSIVRMHVVQILNIFKNGWSQQEQNLQKAQMKK